MASQPILQNNRGIALLITLAVTAILVTAALEYNRRARFEVVATGVVGDQIKLSQMATSGVQAAMAVLIMDKNENNTDSLEDIWADAEKINEIVQDIPFDSGELTIQITDEMGKIQVNALSSWPNGREFNQSQRLLWDRFLQFIGDSETLIEESEPMAIINSIKDWLDSGDDDAITGLSGAESLYYQDLDPPYGCRNGPLQDIDELLMVKGITPELFYGSAEKPGIQNLITAHGLSPGEGTSFTYPGRININTADPAVLVALIPSESQDLVELFNELRAAAVEQKETDDFSDPSWYKSLPGLGDLNLDSRLVTTSSDIFQIVSEASLHTTKLTIEAVVERVKDAKTGRWRCNIISWKTE